MSHPWYTKHGRFRSWRPLVQHIVLVVLRHQQPPNQRRPQPLLLNHKTTCAHAPIYSVSALQRHHVATESDRLKCQNDLVGTCEDPDICDRACTCCRAVVALPASNGLLKTTIKVSTWAQPRKRQSLNELERCSPSRPHPIFRNSRSSCFFRLTSEGAQEAEKSPDQGEISTSATNNTHHRLTVRSSHR